MFHMSYFTAAPRGLEISVGSLEQPERLLRDADASWVELIDLGCELLIFGETSSSLGESVEELDAPENAWDMADPVSHARVALESL